MDPTQTIDTMKPVIQYGFAGFAVLQLAVIVWMFRQLLTQLRSTTRVIHGNTGAIRAVNEVADDTKTLLQDLRDRLLSRPCLREHLAPK
jgi:hypothetical protein